MVAHLRFVALENPNDGSVDTAPIVNGGADLAFYVLERQIVLADFGTGAGQLQDSTSTDFNGGTSGFLFAEWYGPPIQCVFNITLQKPTVPAHLPNPNPWKAPWLPQDGGTVTISYRIDNSIQGMTKLYILDQGTSGEGEDVASNNIQADDIVYAFVGLGYR